MSLNSLTTKIIISVAIIITVVIGIYTFILVKFQTVESRDRERNSGIFISHLLYQHISQVMNTGNKEHIQEFFLGLGNSWEVQHIFVFDENGKIFYSNEESEIGSIADELHLKLFKQSANPINYKVVEDQKTLSVVTLIKNKEDCRRCHSVEHPILGALGVDISLIAAERKITNYRNLFILFSIILLILISAVISILIVRLVKRPIKNLMETMTEVERGNLKVKVDIRNKDELGRLGMSFNSMIARLEKTGVELQKQHEQQMRQAEKLAAIGELASVIAHEIKNPLAGIGSALQVLSKELNLSTTYQEVIDEIMAQLDRLNKNTKALLSFAKPGELKFLESDLNEIINKTVFFIRNKAEEHNTIIILELDQNLSKILIDSEQIQQVFLNIILNAIQAMPDGGSLTIATRLTVNTEQKTKTIAVSLMDTGMGIPKEHLQRIFDPFFTTKNRGTGLGLYISRTIVENHGGHIEVVSEPGKGAVFTVLLPFRKDI